MSDRPQIDPPLSALPRRRARRARRQDRARGVRLSPGVVPRPDQAAGLQGPPRPARDDGRGRGGQGREVPHRRRRQRGRRGQRKLDRPPSWPALEAGLDVASGLHVRLSDLPAVRDAAEANGRHLFDVRHPSQEFKVGTGVPQSRQAPAHGGHRRLGRQDVRHARARSRMAPARRELHLPRDAGQTGHLRRRPRGLGRCGSGGLHLRRYRVARAGERPGSLGPCRGAGLALPPLLRRRDARPDSRRPARRHRGLPRADTYQHAGPAGLAAARARRLHRGQPSGGAAHQSRRHVRGYLRQHRGARSVRRPKRCWRNWERPTACPASIRSAPAWARSPTAFCRDRAW